MTFSLHTTSSPGHAKGWKPLMCAAEAGDVGTLVELLTDGCDIFDLNARDYNGCTSLALAAEKGHAAVKATRYGHTSVVELLLASTELLDVNPRPAYFHEYRFDTPLSIALKEGDQETAELLTLHRYVAAEVQTWVIGSPLIAASRRGDLNTVKSLLSRKEIRPGVRSKGGATALTAAAQGGFDDVVRTLIADGRIDVNSKDNRDRTALSLAAESGSEAVVNELLATRVADTNIQDTLGRTALIWATEPGDGYGPGGWQSYEGAIRRLLANSQTAIDPTAGPGHTSPLAEAAENGHADMVRALLSTGQVDVNTVLTRAYATTVLMALAAGGPVENETVDPNAEHDDGLTPLLLAIKSDQGHEYVKILLSRPDLDVDRPWVVDAAKKNGNMATMALLNIGCASESIQSMRPHSTQVNLPIEKGSQLSRYSMFKETRTETRRRQNAPRSRSQGSGTTSDEPDSDHHTYFTENLEYALNKGVLMEYTLCLGEQQEYVGEGLEETPTLCSTCLGIDLGSAFQTRHTQYKGLVIVDLGRVDETWKSRTCPLCRLFASVYPRTSLEEGHKLVSLSTTQSWLCHEKMIRWDCFRFKLFFDTMLLAVVAADLLVADKGNPAQARGGRDLSPSRREKDVVEAAFSSGLIGRLGRNGPDQGQKESQTDAPPPYVALSYVWGQSQRSQQRPQRQKQQEGLDGIREGIVEPAIEDAIRVTLELGYSYLWVDRYCIVQTGDEAIKQEQLRHMHLVYANAEVTLIAAAGKDSSAGLPGVPGRPREQQPGALINGHALVRIPPDPSLHIRSRSTWATRGWTYQEGLLARRRLYFSEYEMSYECRHMLCREALSLPVGLEQRISGRKPRYMEPFWMYQPYKLPGMDSSQTEIRLFDLSEAYSKRDLSLPSDTLNAILGIFNLLAQHKKRPIYHICGVPILRLPGHRGPKLYRRSRKPIESSDNGNNDDATAVALCGFLDGLCWRLKEPACRRPEFPSWSWTGWDGVVDNMSKDSIAIKQSNGFAIDVSIIPGNQDGGVAVPWSRCYTQLRTSYDSYPDIRSGQSHVLEVTGSAVTVKLRRGEYDGRPNTWIGTVCAGHRVWQGEFFLTSKDVPVSSLLQESWTGIVLGNSVNQRYSQLHDTTVVVIQEQSHQQGRRQGNVQDHRLTDMEVTMIQQQPGFHEALS
ncbi:hypothetical protein FIE12Z_11024 [Fusarium flagelliforme]|uniref:Heterokaryon incompatibility domain-containing protein n=1 Tax=Fusarium flagelliforme TaxID=2675880 RepID=A0A395MA49_9HYPO|nr:hypothetical protein FIE12Z_11024 [Fusarium flagelliforme]